MTSLSFFVHRVYYFLLSRYIYNKPMAKDKICKIKLAFFIIYYLYIFIFNHYSAWNLFLIRFQNDRVVEDSTCYDVVVEEEGVYSVAGKW